MVRLIVRRDDWVWSKWDEKGLARFVDPAAAADVLGKLPEEPHDQPGTADGRRRILELIYDKLLESDISYALEKFSYADAEQEIRTPREILEGTGRGTCLDLSLLFAGLAAEYELLPVVVITEGHAFVIVSMKFGRREYKDFGRSELQVFSELVKDIEVLRKHVADGSYLAIECTGFAASEKLRDNSDPAFPETLGRDKQGLMPFEQALVSGNAQLADRKEELAFALDITVAHEHIDPIEIGNATSIVSERQSAEPITEETAHGEASVAAAQEELVELDLSSPHGARVNPAPEDERPDVLELPTPVRPPIKPLKGLVGRATEKGLIRSAMADEETVGVHSGKGWGKTALMQGIAYADAADYPDGVVYLKVPKQPIEDVLQDIHDQFYRADVPVKPSEATIKQRLADKRAVVILDELGMDSDAVESLSFALRDSFFVLASETPSPFGGARPLQLKGLSPDEALTFFQKRLGREIAAEERDAATQLCEAVDNHPGRLIEARNAVLGGQSVAEVARAYQGTTALSAEVSEAVLADLSPIQRKVAEILAVAKVPVSLDLLERVLADDLSGLPDGLHPAVTALIAMERAEAHSPRYSLTGTVAQAALEHWDPSDWMTDLLTNLADWSESAEVTNDEINRSREFILRALDWGIEAEKWTEVVRVARAVDSGVALGRHWGAWQEVLDRGLMAAEHLGPAGESARAWALHQMGSRAIGIGDDATALARLTEALDIRERLGETEALEVTRHNLNLRTPPPPISGNAVGATIAAALAVLALVLSINPPGWTNGVEFEPNEITFSNTAQWQRVELVNPTDHDVFGIELSISPPTGEFEFRTGTADGSAMTDAVQLLALDMPLALAGTVAADEVGPCDLGPNDVVDLKKGTSCSLEVGFTGSQTGVSTGTLIAQVGSRSIVAMLTVSNPPTTTEPPSTTSTEPPPTTTIAPPPPTTSEPPPTTTPPTDTSVLPAGVDPPIIDIEREIVVFEGDGSQQIRVTNVGGEEVTIEALVQPAHFTAVGCVDDTLTPGKTCTLEVTFTGGSGPYSEILELVFVGEGERKVFLKSGS